MNSIEIEEHKKLYPNLKHSETGDYSDNCHLCEHCITIIDFDQTDTCPNCNISIFASRNDLTPEQLEFLRIMEGL